MTDATNAVSLDLPAYLRRIGHTGDLMPSRATLDALHHEVWQPPDVAGRHEARHVRIGEDGEDHRLRLVGEHVLRRVAAPERRHLHQHRKAGFATGDVIEDALGAGVGVLTDEEIVDPIARHEPLDRGRKPVQRGPFQDRRSGSPAARILRAAARWS